MAASNYQLQTYIVNSGGNPQGPYLIPPSFVPQNPLTDLLINVVSVGGPGASPNSCGISPTGQNADFSMQWLTLPASQLVYAQISVSPAHVYSDKPADRQTLLTSFVAFCAALQDMELTSKPQCLIAGGAAVIANQVAGALPLRVDEILAYYYGFSPSSNYIDLQPGMRLRVETGSYQFVSASSALNAFTTQSQACYSVGRNSSQQLYLSPYLNALTVSVTPTSPPQIGNILDLAALGSRRYFRLIYPSPMNNPVTIYAQPGLSQNVTLLGADTPTDMANATSNYLSTKTCSSASPGNRPIICAYFTGRTTVVPEIPVSYLKQLLYVPVGTTIQNLLDVYNVLQSDQVIPSLGNGNPYFYRNAASPLVVPSGPSQSYGQVPIFFATPTVSVPIPNSSGSLTQWDLPLVKGDSLSWSWT
jgi:hypothetical protein